MKKPVRKIIIALCLVLLLLPLVPLIIWAFSLRWDFPQLLPELNAWAWAELSGEKIISAVRYSLLLSLFVTALSLLFGFFPAKLLARGGFRGARLIELCLLIPVFVPQISVIFGMQRVFRLFGLYSTGAGIVLCQLAFLLPYMTLLLTAAFRSYPPEFEQQALSLGVGRFRTLANVTLPAMRPSLAVCAVFCFIGSWGNYLSAAVMAPPELQTLPVLLFPMMSSGNNSYPLIAVLTIIYISPVLLMNAVSSRLIPRSGDTEKGADGQ